MKLARSVFCRMQKTEDGLEYLEVQKVQLALAVFPQHVLELQLWSKLN